MTKKIEYRLNKLEENQRELFLLVHKIIDKQKEVVLLVGMGIQDIKDIKNNLKALNKDLIGN